MKQTTTIICTIFLLFVWACGVTTYQLADKKYSSIIIQNPGDLYSTYEFSKSDRRELIEQGFKDELIRTMEKMSIEAAWPAGIADLAGRFEMRDAFKTYKAFKIAHIGAGERVILVIPAKANKKMSPKMRPNQDIFFVMEATGIKQ